jgi:hypothetical protein
MIDADRAWSRQAWRFPGKKLSDYRLQGITTAFTLTTGGTTQNQPVTFGAGSIILGICAAARPTAQAATQTYGPGLDLFSIAYVYQADSRSIVGQTEAIGTSVFGNLNDLFPALELVMPQNTAIQYNLTNLTTSTILITLTHHCLLPGAVG